MQKRHGMVITVTAKENPIKRILVKGLQYLWIWLFKHPVYSYGLKEDLIVKLELNFFEVVISSNGDTTAIYNL